LTARYRPLIEYPVGLHREADGHVGRAIENFKDAIANQAAEFAPGPALGGQFDAAIARLAMGTAEIGLSHVREPIPEGRFPEVKGKLFSAFG
jgi:hypothetical protein